MSTPPDNAFDLDLHFLPAWAQQPANKSIYAAHEGESEARDDRRRDRPRERRDRPAPRRDQGPGRPGGPRPGGPQGQRPGDRRGPGRPQGDRFRREEDRGPRPEPIPLPEIEVQFRPDEQGVDSLARQIKMTGRAYPLFGVAQLVLEKGDRYSVTLSTKKKPEGGAVQPLFVCALDDTLWLSEDEAVQYILDKHFATFYQAEKTQTEPPKGTYTFVAQCGMSGAILGPPNYHDYQNQLRKLHAERFSRMPFDAFKARVRIVRDEAVVKKWIEDQSWRTEFNCLNVPEPLKLATREDVEKHFRQTHLANIVKQVDSHQVPGAISRTMPCRPLQRLIRVKWEEQTRFPLQIATTLSQQFASRGLQFFKVNKTVTHVAVARPHYLDLETNVVSENVRRIVQFVDAHPKCTRRKLFESLAPAAKPATPPAAPTPSAEGAPAPAPAEAAPVPELSPEAAAIITDLHWLVHQGHVIEFANGTLETAKKPLPRPPKPEKPAKAEKPGGAPAADAAAEAGAEAAAETEAAPVSGEGSSETGSEQPAGNAEAGTPTAAAEPGAEPAAAAPSTSDAAQQPPAQPTP